MWARLDGFPLAPLALWPSAANSIDPYPDNDFFGKALSLFPWSKMGELMLLVVARLLSFLGMGLPISEHRVSSIRAGSSPLWSSGPEVEVPFYTNSSIKPTVKRFHWTWIHYVLRSGFCISNSLSSIRVWSFPRLGTYLLNLSWLVELASDRIPLTCDSIDYMCPVLKWIQKAWQGRWWLI